ncbi:MAG: alanine racemase [Roseovarius sp.]|nr:alanine racemase [Roseovarius sp.]
MIASLETPKLILDLDRLEQNASRFRQRAQQQGILLRPHLKTSKSAEVARVATGGRMSSVTVSTLKEAEYFAKEGFSDVLYAVGITPNKFDYVRQIQDDVKQNILLILDCLSVAETAVEYSKRTGCAFDFLIEIDCGEHRGGIASDDPKVLEIARILVDAPNIQLRGVMTHAGHSYGTDKIDRIIEIAEDERTSVVGASQVLREVGIPCEIVSAGSTPTFLHGQSFEGLTEMRCGVYVFFDLAQYSRGICRIEDIAISVLATVVGHNRRAGVLTIDAGAFALSKDQSANTYRPDVGYGYICDAATMERLGGLNVSTVHQEHGTVPISDESWFERLPVGSMVRVLPNHACPTSSAHDHYIILNNQRVTARWPRVNGW